MPRGEGSSDHDGAPSEPPGRSGPQPSTDLVAVDRPRRRPPPRRGAAAPPRAGRMRRSSARFRRPQARRKRPRVALAETIFSIASLDSVAKPEHRERGADFTWVQVQQVDGQLRTLVVQAKCASTVPSACGPARRLRRPSTPVRRSARRGPPSTGGSRRSPSSPACAKIPNPDTEWLEAVSTALLGGLGGPAGRGPHRRARRPGRPQGALGAVGAGHRLRGLRVLSALAGRAAGRPGLGARRAPRGRRLPTRLASPPTTRTVCVAICAGWTAASRSGLRPPGSRGARSPAPSGAEHGHAQSVRCRTPCGRRRCRDGRGRGMGRPQTRRRWRRARPGRFAVVRRAARQPHTGAGRRTTRPWPGRDHGVGAHRSQRW